MSKIILCFVVLIGIAGQVFSQERAYFQNLPVPDGIHKSTDPAIPKIGWYRWTTQNFSIHTIDKKQGEYLFANIEKIKSWCLERWGFPNIKFSAEARIFCAPDVDLMKKLFNLDHSAAEFREENGHIVISYLWLILDGKPTEIVPPALSIICLKELEQHYNVKFGLWVYRGVSMLNATIPQIKNNFVSIEPFLQQDKDIFLTKSIVTMTEAEWKNLPPDKQRLFDIESAIFCLLIRKEFGQNNFHSVAKTPNSILEILGFENFNSFDATFVRYMAYLIQDIHQNRTPVTYLQIERVKK